MKASETFFAGRDEINGRKLYSFFEDPELKDGEFFGRGAELIGTANPLFDELDNLLKPGQKVQITALFGEVITEGRSEQV